MTDEPTPAPNAEPTSETPTPEPATEPAPEPETETVPESAVEVTPTHDTAAVSAKLSPKNPYIWGTGRRKAAVARVRVRPGKGQFIVNRRDVDVFFCLDKDRRYVRQPLFVTDTAKAYDVFVNVVGGGTTGQAGAVVLGLARALLKASTDYEPKLREFNLLSRDPRRVERKKYGQRGARRRFQFSKR